MQFNLSKRGKNKLAWHISTILALFMLAGNCYGQKAGDTLTRAKKMRDEGKAKAAFRLLKHYTKDHPDDFNTNWFIAQTAYWANKIRVSAMLYEKLVREHPDNYYLKLDYARMLVDMGSLENAVTILNEYLVYDPANIEALIALAKIDYWEGKYTEAYSKIEKAVKQEPGNNTGVLLKNEILQAMSAWLMLDAAYDNDDQPFQKFTSFVQGGFIPGPLVNLHFALGSSLFVRDSKTDHAILFQAENTSEFYKQHIVTRIGAGLTRFPFKNTTRITGVAGITKTFIKNLIVSVQASRKPYFYSLKSIDTALTEDNIAITAGWNNEHTINGTAGFSSSRFSDKNTVSSFYTTVYSPTFKTGHFNFRFGYGYNYSNAKQNNFIPEKTISEIAANPGNTITGVYDPYFTPNDQQVHSFIASINYQPQTQKKLVIGASVNYGFYATTQNPYFMLINSGNITGVSKGYAEEAFTPVQLGAYLLLPIATKTSLKVSYQYQHTFFYTNHNIALSLKTSFWNEKK